MRPYLAGWFSYMVVLALLMAASAGGRSALGAAAVAAAGAAVVLLAMLFRWPFGGYREVSLALAAAVAAIGALGLAIGRREDTRLIGLMLCAAGVLALILVLRSGAG